jgi:branched-chain amino acid transport system ATP-binding protein
VAEPDLSIKSLSIKALRAGYGSLDILNGVDLDVPQGQFVALMGPNGAGKSTLLKSLYGMTTIKGGSIDWQGKNIAGYKSRAILAEGISLVPQGRCNFPLMTIDENLQMAAYTLRDARVKADRDYVYDLFLKTRRNTLAGNMSGGEQQLLEVAMAVLQRPKILLVDEPSVGLSPAAIAIVFNELLRINAAGQTILLVEQNTKKAMEVAHRAVILRLGRVIWDGRPVEITHDELGELFLTGRMRGETQAEH